MKLSVSLPDDDVEFLDDYAHEQGIGTRSAALHRAIRLLRASGLSSAYEDAWDQWSAAGEADLWDATIGDGIERR
jgi:Arc/MetJ-type ribon-helix-helix transcriptional regulator